MLLFFIAAIRYLLGGDPMTSADLLLPFYNPETFSVQHVFTGTSIAVLTYIGFDGIST